MYHWDFGWVWTYRRELAAGLGWTLLLNLAVLAVGMSTGVVLGALSRGKGVVMAWVYRIYVDVFRTLPVLVGLVWAYYCLPVISPSLALSGFWAAVLVLGLNLGAFVAEIVRAGLKEAEEAWLEGSLVLGLPKPQIMKLILLPLVWRLMLPPLTGQIINTIKLSVLASVVAVPELMHETQDVITQTYRPLEFYTLLALFFLALLLPPAWWSKKLERQR